MELQETGLDDGNFIIQNNVAHLASEYIGFVSRYKNFFVTKTKNIIEQAQQYMCGLMQAPKKKKNMEKMAEVVPEANEQSLQHFLTNSTWSWRALLDQIAQDANDIFAGKNDTCLIIDESGIVKRGKKSVGVARQYCGRLGKIENCQVGVFASLSCQGLQTIIDGRLYLPKKWTDDAKRCRKAKIPEEDIIFKKKTKLAIEMVKQARSNGIDFGWVGADGGYGKEPDFLRELDDNHEVFVVDVHKNQMIYLNNPKPYIPSKKTELGPKTKRLISDINPVRVDKWMEIQPEESWERITIRGTTKGDLVVDILHRIVWLWDKEETKGRRWHLIVRREIESPSEIKYSLSNAKKQTKTKRLAFMQAQRYFVERSIQDGKSECGLADYQVRHWNSWYHHIALVSLAMLFILNTRLSQRVSYPLLSCADVVLLLAHFLPRRDDNFDEVLRQMQQRHAKRQSSIDSAYRKQAKVFIGPD